MITDTRTPEELAAAISAALAARYGGRETAHHKAWVIDQMCRALTGDGYTASAPARTARTPTPGTRALHHEHQQ
ncbi:MULTISPECIES: hypothetical protein [Photorhabdus]|uniref:Uncharacterized protein n=1 Tax=Photorhabdus thracensis TaxID=230089 RepID=A0A0F7LTL9_9GAMM|nr:hypothetical protein [Photorhabdus thracensis]AKH65256.1 hypothetical protein VY86_19785 [Photorhabdus thracensis]